MTLSLKKIRVSFDYLSIAAVCVMIVLSSDSRFAAAVVCTVIHEVGHITVMLLNGCEKVEIAINLFNVAIKDRDRNVRSYIQDIFIICAGPLANILTAAAAFVVYTFSKCSFVYNIMIISIMLAIFNLLPLESTDGGQLLFLMLNKKFSSEISQRIITVISIIVLFPVAAVGFLVLLRSKYNYTLLFAALYLIAVVLINTNSK